MGSFAAVLGKGEAEVARWDGVRDKHVALTRSLWNKDAQWFCDFNSATQKWQSGCDDEAPTTQWDAGAGKQTYQLAPLFFHNPALGVDILGDDIAPAVPALVDAVSNPKKFGSDPPGSLTFTTYCTSQPVDARCVESIWAPHPFMIIASAGQVNASAAASETTTRLLDRVWGKMDVRTRTHFPPTPSPFGRSTSPGSPYPGMTYECFNVARPLDNVTAMEQSCGSEDYAWTAEATTVSLIREIVGFRERPLARGGGDFAQRVPAGVYTRGHGAFALRPALPRRLLRQRGAVFTVRSLQFRGVTFDVHYTIADAEAGLLDVRVQEAGAAGGRRCVSFRAENARSEHRIDVSATAFKAVRV